MAGVNKVIIVGNLGRDPEMRYTPSGSAVTNFSVAVSRNRKLPDGGTEEETEWFNVDCWNRLAEIANQYLSKGRPVYIEGRIHLDTWDDRTSGEKRSRLKVFATELQLIGSRADNAEGGSFSNDAGASRSSAGAGANDDFDNMPF
jgi:single-strand DNA-binding protein